MDNAYKINKLDGYRLPAKLTWNLVFADFFKKVFFPFLYFLIVATVTTKIHTLDEINPTWIAEYFLYCAIPVSLTTIRYINFSTPVSTIGSFFFEAAFCIPKVIWWFIRMEWYLVITIIRVIRLSYQVYQRRKVA